MKRHWIIMALITAIALALRMIGLLKYGLQYDDVISFGYPGMFYSFWNHADRPFFFYYLFMRYLHQISGNELVVRLPAVLWGVVSLFPAYLFAAKLFGRKTGLITAYLLAVSPFFICYAQEIRMYTFLFLLGCLSSVFFLSALETASRRAWAGLVICNSIAAYLHFLAVLLIPAQVLYVLLYRKKYRVRGKELGTVFAVQGIMLLPWMYVLCPQYANILQRPQFANMLQWMQGDRRILTFLGPITVFNFFYTFKNFCSGFYSTGAVRNVFFILMAGVISVGARKLFFEQREKLSLLVLFFCFPIISLIAVSYFRPVYSEKFVLVSLLFFYVLAAHAISRWKTSVAGIVLILITVLSGISLRGYYLNQIYPVYSERTGVVSRKEFRKAAEYIKARYEDGDLIVHTSAASTLPIAYYLDPHFVDDVLQGHRIFKFFEEAFHFLGRENLLIFYEIKNKGFAFYKDKEEFTAQERDEFLDGYRRVWLVYSYWESPVPVERLKGWFDGHFTLIEGQKFEGVQVFLYRVSE